MRKPIENMDWNKIALVFVFFLMFCGSGYGYRHLCTGYGYFTIKEHELTDNGKITIVLKNGPSVINVTGIEAKQHYEKTGWLSGEISGLVTNLEPYEEFTLSIQNNEFANMTNNYNIDVRILYYYGGMSHQDTINCYTIHNASCNINYFSYFKFFIIIYVSFILFAYGFDKKKIRDSFKKILVLVPILIIVTFIWFIVLLYAPVTLLFFGYGMPQIIILISSILLFSYLISYGVMKYLTGLDKPILSFMPELIVLTLIWIVCMSSAFYFLGVC